MDEMIWFGLYQSCGTGGVLDVCLYFFAAMWVGGLDQSLEGCCYVCVSCEAGFSV